MRACVGGFRDKPFLYVDSDDCRRFCSADWTQKEKCARGSKNFCVLCAVPVVGGVLYRCQIEREGYDDCFAWSGCKDSD